MPDLEKARAPERHCLLIDQGNSRVKWIGAVWHAMAENWSLDVTTFGEGDAQALGSALDSGALFPPQEVLLCSVAPEESMRALEEIIADRTAAPLVRLAAQAETCGIRNGYRAPEQLGADRWMAVVGAARHHGTPVVVMDLGTASTLDAVDERGRHLGGLILPGPRTMLDSLSGRTALDTGFDTANRAGRKAGEPQVATPAAIEGGILAAQAGALAGFADRVVARVQERMDENTAAKLKIVVTGGAAGAILKASLGPSGYQLTHDPLLVFRGMLLCHYASGDSQL